MAPKTCVTSADCVKEGFVCASAETPVSTEMHCVEKDLCDTTVNSVGIEIKYTCSNDTFVIFIIVVICLIILWTIFKFILARQKAKEESKV